MNTILPGGTVTFLFTDIEGSTRLWEMHPEAMKVALAQHYSLLRTAIAANHGQVIKTTGDGLHAVFASAAEGVGAVVMAQHALQAQVWPATCPLRVRMALHTGEAEIRDGDYYGAALNRAARLMAVGAGGQILVSNATAEVMRDQLPVAVTLRDLGEHRLKDLIRPEHVFQIVAPDLPADFPSLKSLNSFSQNLPVQLTSFVGRDKEIAAAKQLLASTRLLTLTGPGGIGKTRLALQIAAEVLPDFPDGTWLVELAPISDASLAPDAIVQALKINMAASQTSIELLRRFLRKKNILILLDNFEHLLDAALIVADLLAAAPRLTILATSRERLHLYGEQEYPVRPMQLPGAQDVQPIEQILGYDACNLFYQRAKKVKPGLSIDQVQANAIAQLCIRLDGLPLAVELAASQVRIFSPATISERIKESLASLPDGPRDLPSRQRTLRATIDWSLQLLQEEEKKLFARLSIFNGGATLDGIHNICKHGISNFMDTIAGLLDKNLLYVRDDPTGEPRFSMLETIREYATEQLENLGEAADIRQSHAEYFSNMAEQAKGDIRGFKGKYWYTRLRLEQDNLRSVMAWSLAGEQVDYGLRIIASLKDYWVYTGNEMEGFRWINTGMNVADIARPELVAGLLLCGAHVSFRIEDYERGIGWGQRALEIYRSLGDSLNIAWSLEFLSIIKLVYQERSQDSLAMSKEALRLFRLQGDQPGIAQALNSMGEIYRISGEIVEAKQCYEECLAMTLQSGDQLRQSILYSNLSLIAFKQKEYKNAVRFIQSSIRIVAEQDNLYGIATYIPILAGPVAALGDGRWAARLLGASQSMLENMGAGHDPTDERDVISYEEFTRSLLGEKDFEKAWQEGMALSIQEVTAYALEEIELPE